MKRRSSSILLAAIVIACSVCGPAHAAPPLMLWQEKAVPDPATPGGARTNLSIMRLADGSFAFFDRYHSKTGPVSLLDSQAMKHTLLPALPAGIVASQTISDSGVLANTQVMLTTKNQVISVFVKGEALDKETAAKVGLPRYLDVWTKHASPTEASEPRMIWRGYNGSQMEYEQLKSGRILVPFGSFQPHGKSTPPNGRHKTVIQYSDDEGRTWKESESKLVSPCYAGFNGSNEGACEPAFEQLQDGRIWMVMRTQAGFLYESYSADDGTTWQPAGPSRFSTSTGPANILRHKNGWLVLTWNNCEMPPRAGGQGVYGGRDALHIAVSDDEGKTWRGFREIYLDHRRNDNPAKNGDRGTAYPLGAYTEEGKIVIIAGQGAGGRNPILIDPEWIVEKEAYTDFSDGLKQWSVYTHHGPAERWWQARSVGCNFVVDPQDATKRRLHVRKHDELPADGAVWNFPNAWKGRLTARVMVREDSAGGMLCLNDRFFDPTNDWGEEFSVFRLELKPDGQIGTAKIEPGQWHDITLAWDLGASACRLQVDGMDAGVLKVRQPTLNGISYVRFRSSAQKIDQLGFYVESVRVTVDDPYAPACDAQVQREHERRYVESIVSLWTK